MEEGVFFGPKNATPSQVVIKVRAGAEKRFFFGSLKRNLLLRKGIKSNPGPVTIGETLSWYRNLLREIKKLHHKGQGKAGAAFHEIPPTDFFP